MTRYTYLRKAQARRGLTLLEVIVSMAIFLLSIIAIFHLLSIGTNAAIEVRLQTRTSMRCQAKLAEVMCGAQALASTGTYSNFDDSDPDKDLQWRMEATPADDIQMLWMVKVWVKADLPSGEMVESQLSQMVINPSMRGTTFDQTPTPNSGQANTGN